MKSYDAPDGERFLLRIDKGEELLLTLAAFAAEQQLPAASFTGIGAVRDAVLGYFDVATRQYERHSFAETMELVTLCGNVSWLDSQPLVHAHATLAGRDLRPVAGHLFSAVVAVTGEISVTGLGRRVERAVDPASGLNLLR